MMRHLLQLMSLTLLWMEVACVSFPLAAVVGIVPFCSGFLSFLKISFLSFFCKGNETVAFVD